MGGDLNMTNMKKVFRIFQHVVFFILFLYLVIAGQMNSGLVKVIEKATGVTKQGVIGLGFMLLGLCGFIYELHFYNKKYR